MLFQILFFGNYENKKAIIFSIIANTSMIQNAS
jgi:hypothetical protein